MACPESGWNTHISKTHPGPAVTFHVGQTAAQHPTFGVRKILRLRLSRHSEEHIPINLMTTIPGYSTSQRFRKDNEKGLQKTFCSPNNSR